MAKDSFDHALALVLATEGGYINDPQDPGGETNKGVTKAVYDAWRDSQDLPIQSVKLIGDDELAAIYRRQYWDQVHGDDLPAGLDYAVFDYGVNSGPRHAVEDLQRVLRVPVDGKVGLLTLNALAGQLVEDDISDLCARRLAFLKTLHTWGRFGEGWAARVAAVEHDASVMASDVKAGPIAAAAALDIHAKNAVAGAAQKAPPSDVSITKTSGASVVSHTVAGGVATAIAAAGTYAPQVIDSASKARDYIAPHVHYLPILEKGLGALTAVIIGGAAVGWVARWCQARKAAH